MTANLMPYTLAARFSPSRGPTGDPAVTPTSLSERRDLDQALLRLCFDSDPAGEAVEAEVRALLEAGADPNARSGGRYDLPARYAVTGHRHAPRITRLLLEAGANPTDGESAFHAAERYHVEALELLLEYGVDLNDNGDRGNTPLYFLLRYWDVAREEQVGRGLRWLLDSTHAAIRRHRRRPRAAGPRRRHPHRGP